MKRRTIGLSLAGLPLTALALLAGQAKPADVAKTQAAELQDVLERMEEGGKRWLEVVDRSTLELGVYRLSAGEVDGQEPHALDEIYYVVEGRARFTADGQTHDVTPGSMLFVEARVEHRFHDVEEDLVTLVFFSKHPPKAG